MNAAYVTMEGFQLGKTFVVKELHLLAEDGDDHKHFVFASPIIPLSPQDQRTVRYTTRYLHGIGWYEGDVPYIALSSILEKFQNHILFTYGYTTTNFLREMLPLSVIVDLQKDGYTMPSTLPPKPCFKQHNPRHCATAKAHALRDHFQSSCDKEDKEEQ